jgi:hypothetical protein
VVGKLKYQIFYKETLIGVLEINEEGQYRYTPDVEAVETLKNEVPLTREMLEKSDWREPIPFFKERIENGSRFNLDVIRYHTDLFKMVKVSE